MDLEQKAFERLRLGAETSERLYNAPLIICYSGGKDSDVLLQLALNSGINFEVLHNHTTVDAPETVYHIRDTFRRLELQGVKCTVEKPTYKGEKGNNVVVDTAGNVTANTINAVLLLCPKGKRGEKQGYCDRCSQSRKPFTL